MALHSYSGTDFALLERNSFRSTKLLSVIDWVMRQSNLTNGESVSAAVSEVGETSTNDRFIKQL